MFIPVLFLLPSCILFDSDAIVIQGDAAPIALSIEINSPIDGAQYIADTPIFFEAEITEQNNQLDGLDIAWYSSIDGPLTSTCRRRKVPSAASIHSVKVSM